MKLSEVKGTFILYNYLTEVFKKSIPNNCTKYGIITHGNTFFLSFNLEYP